MQRPLIGLSGRRKKGDQLVGNFETLADLDIDLYYTDYARAVYQAGGMPMHLPLDVDAAEALDYCDGLLLSGGADIAPVRYGRDPDPDLTTPEPERDAFELGLLDAATATAVPTLGICRGIQMVNVHAGGTLNQHVPAHAAFDQAPSTEWHEVDISPGSTLREIYGPSHSVNSLHHQTIDAVATGYAVTARADDGVVEALEHEDLPIVAVQWHPEMMATRDTDPIFGWLVDASRARAHARA